MLERLGKRAKTLGSSFELPGDAIRWHIWTVGHAKEREMTSNALVVRESVLPMEWLRMVGIRAQPSSPIGVENLVFFDLYHDLYSSQEIE